MTDCEWGVEGWGGGLHAGGVARARVRYGATRIMKENTSYIKRTCA